MSKPPQLRKGDLTKMFAELHECQGNSKKALQLCNQILTAAPGDKDAVAYKIHLLIENSRFSDCVKFIQSEPPKVAKAHSVHLAYSLYRLNKLKEAEAALKTGTMDSEAEKHLMAQVQYKKESFGEAAQLYREMLRGGGEDEEEEVLCNLSASLVCGGKLDEAQEMLGMPDSELTQDLLTNKAYLFLVKGDLKRAQQCLLAAERDCREAHQEDGPVNEASLNDDLSTIRVQTAYIKALEAKEDEAIALLTEVLKVKPSSFSTLAVASNNICALQSENKTVFDAFKRLKPLRETQFDARLSSDQRLTIRYNTAILMSLMGQKEVARSHADSIIRDHPSSPLGPMASATLLCKEKKFVKAEDVLRGYLQKNSEGHPEVQLLLAQIYFQQGNMKGTVSQLTQVEKLRHQLGLVATLVEAYEQQGNTAAAVTVIEDAIAYWREAAASSSSTSPTSPGAKRCLLCLLQAAAQFFLKQKQWDRAGEMYKELQQLGASGDAGKEEALLNTAGLVLASSRYDLATAEELSQQLDAYVPASDITPEQASELLAHKIRELQTARRAAAAQPSSPTHDKTQKKKKKKAAGSNKTAAAGQEVSGPDPDRWKAWRDRAAYKALTKRQVREIKKDKQDEKNRRLREAAKEREVMREQLKAYYEVVREKEANQ